MEIVDIKPSKEKFSWSNKIIELGHMVASLGQFLVHGDILTRDSIIPLKIIPSTIYDHKLILLILEESLEFGSLPFRSNPFWLQDEKVMEVISKACCSFIVGSPVYIWEQKLTTLKVVLKNWVKNSCLSLF